MLLCCLCTFRPLPVVCFIVQPWPALFTCTLYSLGSLWDCVVPHGAGEAGVAESGQRFLFLSPEFSSWLSGKWWHVSTVNRPLCFPPAHPSLRWIPSRACWEVLRLLAPLSKPNASRLPEDYKVIFQKQKYILPEKGQNATSANTDTKQSICWKYAACNFLSWDMCAVDGFPFIFIPFQVSRLKNFGCVDAVPRVWVTGTSDLWVLTLVSYLTISFLPPHFVLALCLTTRGYFCL